MPRVKQEKLRLEIDPARPNAETVVYTYYNNAEHRGYDEKSTERFSISLPDVVAGALGRKEVTAVDQKTVRSRFLEAIEQFKNLTKEVNRVIIYRIEVAPDDRDSRPNYMRSSISGLKVEVWAGTFEETISISGNGQKRYTYLAVESSLAYPGTLSRFQRDGDIEKKQVPWTEINEAFFKWVGDNLLGLIKRLCEIDDPVKLVETINAGLLLPLGKA